MDILHEEQKRSIQQVQGIQSLDRKLHRKEDQYFSFRSNSHQMNSKSYAKIQGLRGSYPLHIIHNRMGLQKESIERSWKL